MRITSSQSSETTALNDLNYLRADILLHIIRHQNSIISFPVHSYCGIHGLKQTLLINPRQDKASLVQGFRALGAGSDAYRRERMPHRSKVAALLRQRAGIGHSRNVVHLQTVIIVKSHQPPVQLVV